MKKIFSGILACLLVITLFPETSLSIVNASDEEIALTDGSKLESTGFSVSGSYDSNGLVKIYIQSDENWRPYYGLMNTRGEVVLECNYTEITRMDEYDTIYQVVKVEQADDGTITSTGGYVKVNEDETITTILENKYDFYNEVNFTGTPFIVSISEDDTQKSEMLYFDTENLTFEIIETYELSEYNILLTNINTSVDSVKVNFIREVTYDDYTYEESCYAYIDPTTGELVTEIMQVYNQYLNVSSSIVGDKNIYFDSVNNQIIELELNTAGDIIKKTVLLTSKDGASTISEYKEFLIITTFEDGYFTSVYYYFDGATFNDVTMPAGGTSIMTSSKGMFTFVENVGYVPVNFNETSGFFEFAVSNLSYTDVSSSVEVVDGIYMISYSYSDSTIYQYVKSIDDEWVNVTGNVENSLLLTNYYFEVYCYKSNEETIYLDLSKLSIDCPLYSNGGINEALVLDNEAISTVNAYKTNIDNGTYTYLSNMYLTERSNEYVTKVLNSNQEILVAFDASVNLTYYELSGQLFFETSNQFNEQIAIYNSDFTKSITMGEYGYFGMEEFYSDEDITLFVIYYKWSVNDTVVAKTVLVDENLNMICSESEGSGITYYEEYNLLSFFSYEDGIEYIYSFDKETYKVEVLIDERNNLCFAINSNVGYRYGSFFIGDSFYVLDMLTGEIEEDFSNFKYDSYGNMFVFNYTNGSSFNILLSDGTYLFNDFIEGSPAYNSAGVIDIYVINGIEYYCYYTESTIEIDEDDDSGETHYATSHNYIDINGNLLCDDDYYSLAMIDSGNYDYFNFTNSDGMNVVVDTSGKVLYENTTNARNDYEAVARYTDDYGDFLILKYIGKYAIYDLTTEEFLAEDYYFEDSIKYSDGEFTVYTCGSTGELISAVLSYEGTFVIDFPTDSSIISRSDFVDGLSVVKKSETTSVVYSLSRVSFSIGGSGYDDNGDDTSGTTTIGLYDQFNNLIVDLTDDYNEFYLLGESYGLGINDDGYYLVEITGTLPDIIGVESVEIINAPDLLELWDNTYILTAIINPSDSSYQTISWSTENTSETSGGMMSDIVYMESTGLIYAANVGTANITATVGGVSTTISVRVVEKICTVTFETNGASELDDQLIGVGDVITKPENPTKDDYTFVGWYQDVEFVNEWDFEEVTVEELYTLYAKWDKNESSTDTDTGTGTDTDVDTDTDADADTDTDSETSVNTTILSDTLTDDLNTSLDEDSYSTIFTEKELSGTDELSVVLTVKDLGETNLTSEEEAAIEELISNLDDTVVIGRVLDITLSKIVGGVTTSITELGDTIRITIDIPEDLLSLSQEFIMIRIHDGVATVLEDLDDVKETFTFETDCFSTYILSYVDADTTVDTDSSVDTETDTEVEDSVDTGDMTNIAGLFSLLLLSGFVGLLTLRKKA